ncbi:MAG: hypothetical protein JSS72_01185 [Armatimonadetes bacterium]|nr:hypothetical protein [Armatimonadota bacterium]
MQALLETWDINARLNTYLLAAIPDDLLAVKQKGMKCVLGNFTHIHNVRLMWLKASAPELMAGLEKAEEPLSKAKVLEHLEASAAAIRRLIESAGSPEGKIKGFKPHAAAFVGYMIAHEAYHRTCAEVVLRQNGTPIDDKTSYGLWEWGSR